jgi:two-component system cell cycle response regulator
MNAKGNTLICYSPVPSQDLSEQVGAQRLMYLIIVRGGIPGTMLRLSHGTSSLGRSADNTFQLHDSTVSRRHALVTIESEGVTSITDLGSTNGTFVDGKRCPDKVETQISDGSRIQLGSSVLLKFLKLDPCDEGFQREMYERTVRDNLTGLYNRGYFLSQIGPLAELNAVREMGLAVILVDIDHFKRINDTHGHDVGDQVLRDIAAVLRESTRAEDLVARYGGEEFVIALPSATLEQAAERAERIRAGLANCCMDFFHPPIRVTASLGLSFAPAGRGRNTEALISEADRSLYEAKNQGRNRVVTARRATPQLAVKTESADGFAIY